MTTLMNINNKLIEMSVIVRASGEVLEKFRKKCDFVSEKCDFCQKV